MAYTVAVETEHTLKYDCSVDHLKSAYLTEAICPIYD